MACEYQFYKDNEFIQRLYCNISGLYCPYSKMCYKVNKFVETDLQERCQNRMDEKVVVPDGAKKVLFVKKGFLYVQVDDDHVEKFENIFQRDNIEFVWIENGKVYDKPIEQSVKIKGKYKRQ